MKMSSEKGYIIMIIRDSHGLPTHILREQRSIVAQERSEMTMERK